jgi:hypothetical protein
MNSRLTARFLEGRMDLTASRSSCQPLQAIDVRVEHTRSEDLSETDAAGALTGFCNPWRYRGSDPATIAAPRLAIPFQSSDARVGCEGFTVKSKSIFG